MERPLFLPKLQAALSCLYGSESSRRSPQNRNEAHEFLLDFRSSNVRRSVISRLQSHRDRSDTDLSLRMPEEECSGSVFLSCLALILQSTRVGANHKIGDGGGSHERVFAAQSLNHRCRSIRLVETLDVEAEDGVERGVARLVLTLAEIRAERTGADASNNGHDAAGPKSRMVLTAWVERYIPMLVRRCGCGRGGGGGDDGAGDTVCDGAELLALVLQSHSSSLLADASGANPEEVEKREENIKGTLIMLSLVVAMYVSAFCDYGEEHHQSHRQQQSQPSSWANTVLSDLGSALSITALRIRYRPVRDKYATPPPEPSCPPLIGMLVNVVNAVKESAEAYFSQKIQQQQQQHLNDIGATIRQAHQHAVRRSVAACMRALPETVLLPPGHDEDGGHRIPSVDRACLRAASMELRGSDGMGKAWRVLAESERGDGSQDANSAVRLLESCEAWARFVAVPIPVVETTVGSLAVVLLRVSQQQQQQERAQAAAFEYLVSIFESASPSLAPGDILTAALGVGASGHKGKGVGGRGTSRKNANVKKKQGNTRKKRQERRLGKAIAVQDNGQAGGSSDAAEAELLARRNAACVAAAAAFGVSLADGSILGDDWGLRPAASSPSTSTHGVCSTVAAAATSVLPHLLCLEREDDGGGGSESSQRKWRLGLFSAIVTAIRRICASPIRDIRALAYEPLTVLHTSLNSVAYVCFKMEQAGVDTICECTLALATCCGYPHGYFDHLNEDNDEDLEIERNDVRETARGVCNLNSGDDVGTHGQKSPSILILERIVAACSSSMQNSDHLPPETAVHILSALAKPLNRIGKKYKEQPSATGCAIMTMAMTALGRVCDQLNSSLNSHPMSQILPLSRLALMGTASLSPMFSSLAEEMNRPAANEAEKEMFMALKRTLTVSLQHSMLSSAKIPELFAESSLKLTRYDIRGAMRGPGGEDHVGCIALLRLSHQSDYLVALVFQLYGPGILYGLSSLHRELKASETKRGASCDYGTGVTPVSRRLILKVISRLSLYEMRNGPNCEGRAVIQQLLQAPLAEMRSQREAPFSVEKLYRLCEAAFDLSYFSPEFVADLFSNPSNDFGITFECVITGYSRLLFASGAENAMCRQWGRLRGGVQSVLSTSLQKSISDYSASIISALIKSECGAATNQCNQGPQSGSSLFNDGVVGEEMVQAGLYIMLIKDCLDRIAKMEWQQEKFTDESRRCMSILKDVSPAVILLLLHQSPEALSHVDPRPTIAEAWFLAIESLVSICRKHDQVAAHLAGDGVESFLGDSLSLAQSLVFLKDLGTKKASALTIQKGMSLDGPHILAMVSFVSESMLLGPTILLAGGKSILSIIQVNCASSQDDIFSQSVLTASFLRAVSGALPPWAVEETPILFQSIYVAMGSDCDKFIQGLAASTNVKASTPFGGIRAGELLAGRFLEVSNRHIESFLSQSKEVCIKGDWKKLKVVLKATCGGKKKDSGFNLKPQFTSWECDRL